MNNTLSKIGIFESISLIVIVMLNNIVLNVPKEIINSTSSGAWLNVIFLTIICVGFVLIICKLFKKFPYMDIIDISEFVGGKLLKILIGTSFIALFALLNGTAIRIFVGILQVSFLNNSPIIFITAFFLIGTIVANKLGIKAMAKVSTIICITVIIGIFILLVSLNNYYTVDALFPVLGYGVTETFLGGLTNIYAFAGICFLYFIKPFSSSSKDFTKITVTSVIISGILLLLSIFNQILMFGVVFNSEVLMGLILSCRILDFGNFFQRVDAIFTFLWIFSHLCYLSITTFFALYSFKKITNINEQNGMLYTIILIIFSICLFPKNFSILANNLIPFTNTFKTILVFIVIPIILILANLKFKGKYLSKQGGKDD